MSITARELSQRTIKDPPTPTFSKERDEDDDRREAEGEQHERDEHEGSGLIRAIAQRRDIRGANRVLIRNPHGQRHERDREAERDNDCHPPPADHKLVSGLRDFKVRQCPAPGHGENDIEGCVCAGYKSSKYIKQQ
jgi:hypothetical protein